MKKLMMILLVVPFLLIGVSSAKADLIGITEGMLDKPDVLINGGIVFNYDYVQDGLNTLTITAHDEKITLSDGSKFTLTDSEDWNPETIFSLTIKLDDYGNLVPTVLDDPYQDQVPPDMTEELIRGEVMEGWDGTRESGYAAPAVLLSGYVYSFGWAEVLTDEARFDFLLNNMAGAWVDTGLWPDTVPTAIIISTVAVGGAAAWGDENPWDQDWTVTSGKADKAPVPEPATMLLVGSGLIGLAGIGRKKFLKRG